MNSSFDVIYTIGSSYTANCPLNASALQYNTESYHVLIDFEERSRLENIQSRILKILLRIESASIVTSKNLNSKIGFSNGVVQTTSESSLSPGRLDHSPIQW